MSIALVPTAIGGASAVVSSAAIIKNILAGLVPSASGLDAIAVLAKDIGGFEFDYIGEERLEAGVEITKHYTESNKFMQDHRAVQPTVIMMRGFKSEVALSKTATIPLLTALASSLAPVTPYLGRYSPGTAAKMNAAVNQTDQILNQLAQIASVGGSIAKLVGVVPGTTQIEQAYNKLDALRNSGTAFAVVTPWATFGDVTVPPSPHGPMMIEHMVLVGPEETRSWTDIVVRLVEIREAPSIVVSTLDNARGSELPAYNGAVGQVA